MPPIAPGDPDNVVHVIARETAERRHDDAVGLADLDLVQEAGRAIARIPGLDRRELEEDVLDEGQGQVPCRIDDDGAAQLARQVAGIDHASAGWKHLANSIGRDRTAGPEPCHHGA